MKLDKGLMAGSSTMLVLTLLESGDMYGYQMIEELARRSNDVFQMQEGTLYPILHALEREGAVQAYEQEAPGNRIRRYYRITPKGRKLLEEKKARVKVLRSHDKWYGVTYQEDKPAVMAALADKTARGLYPDELWG